jgi:hypothetical protein
LVLHRVRGVLSREPGQGRTLRAGPSGRAHEGGVVLLPLSAVRGPAPRALRRTEETGRPSSGRARA